MTDLDAIQIIEGDVPSESTAQTAQAWATLIKSGLVWRLQGSYGRAAKDLIDHGIISKEGVVLRE
jgi:hypothetical protein